MRVNVPIGKVRARAFKIPTDKPEADGTITWELTTLIVVEVFAGNVVGLAYTYAGASITTLIESKLAETIAGLDAMDPQAASRAMQRAVRNLGREGLVATAISAVDAALCPTCVVSLQTRGKHKRTLQGNGGENVTLSRTYGTCPRCGEGLFPPG